MSLNLAVLLVESAVRQPGRTVLTMDKQRLTYGELNAAANKVANALRSLGIRRGDKVAILMPNVPQFAIIYYGILKLGATVIPLDVGCQATDIQACLCDCDAAALFAWEGHADVACAAFQVTDSRHHLIIVNQPGSDVLPNGAISYNAMLAIGSSVFDVAATMPDDTAVIAYVRHPAGQVKGAELTHFNLFYNAVILADRLLNLGPDTVGLAIVPLVSVFGQTCVLNSLVYVGGAISLLPQGDASAALDAIARHRVTYVPGPPAVMREVLSSGKLTTTLNVCLVEGGATLSAAEYEWLAQVEPPVVMAYGRTETSPLMTMTPLRAPRPGSIGLPIWGTEMRLVDDDGLPVPPGEIGEIVVCGHNVMKGYFGQPEATAAVLHNGWFHTGDMARQDESGYLYLVESGSNATKPRDWVVSRDQQE